MKLGDKVSARDMFIYLTGENLSTTMAQIYNTTMQEAAASNNSDLVGYAKAITALRKLYRQQAFTEAKQEFDKLPSSLKKEKAIQLIYLQIASGIGGDSYVEALNEFERLYGQDASSQLALLDAYFVKADYDKVLQVIDKMDRTLKDPFLDYYRSLVYSQRKEDKKAIAYLEKLQQHMPGFEDGTLELLANYISAGQYRDADRIVATYKANPTFKQGRLNDVKELYPDNAENVKW